jgi:hypothetical protein
MWRILTFFLVGGVLGTGFGVALGFFLFPYVFPPPEAMERLTVSEQTAVVARGTFVHANPSDPVHYGKGGVTVYEKTVFLGEDFEVGPGPKFHVYLVPKQKIRSSGDVKETMFLDLGRLRAFKGSQKYVIPNGVDLSKYSSVVIWCAEFSVLISPADLKFL